MEGLELLLKYVSKSKTVWKSTRMAHHKSIRESGTALLEDADANEAVASDSLKPGTDIMNGNVTTAGRTSTSSMESKQLLLEAVASPEHTWIEDRLRAHEKGLPLPNGGDSKAGRAGQNLTVSGRIFHLGTIQSRMCWSRTLDS